jgi:hypothetical protein
LSSSLYNGIEPPRVPSFSIPPQGF